MENKSNSNNYVGQIYVSFDPATDRLCNRPADETRWVPLYFSWLTAIIYTCVLFTTVFFWNFTSLCAKSIFLVYCRIIDGSGGRGEYIITMYI